MMNKLANSQSSYLKRAANEPIDWYPWCDEAFERARAEDRPILLSIGAVWCHWCHVMARESWQDPETASIVNSRYIAIKVDRDERPDLDKAYQEAVSALTGQGGWPLTVFLTPEKRPFYGGTYFPAKQGHGYPALKSVLSSVSDAYKNDKGAVRKIVGDLSHVMGQLSVGKGPVNDIMLDEAVGQIASRFDIVNGGFGTAPKFPLSEVLLFMLQTYEETKNEELWHIVDVSLRHMAAGGFYDQLGGGFHRYSTDAGWKVPHFEKMLNDNALLLMAYLQAYRRSGSQYFRQAAQETLNFVLGRMARSPAGFNSSVDADLHGEEGGYFTWTEAEIRSLLGEKAGPFIQAYQAQETGNMDVPGKNVLYVPGESDKSRFGAEKKILLEARDRREMPFVDTSVHVSWTSLMATSLIEAYNVLGDARSLDYAVKTMDFMMKDMYRNGTLYRLYTDKPSVDGFLDDYSCTVEALLELFNASGDVKYLDYAVELTEQCDAKFYDRNNGGYFYVQEKDRTPMTMDKPSSDFSVPGSNPQMALNLMKLSYCTGEDRYMDRANEVLETFSVAAQAYPIGNATYYRAVDYYLNPPLQAVILADPEDCARLARLINGRLVKRVVLMENGHGKSPLFEGKERMDGKPTVYFCREGTCTVPLNDIEKIEDYLDIAK
ncbi:MAG TPA: thioredoxin domain-containing protein [Methanocellaceae archaeon]